MKKREVILLWPVRTKDLVLTTEELTKRQLVDPQRVPLRTTAQYTDEYGTHSVGCWIFALNLAIYRHLPGNDAAPLETEDGLPNSKWLIKAKHYLLDLEGTICASWINHDVRGLFLLDYFGQQLELDRLTEL